MPGPGGGHGRFSRGFLTEEEKKNRPRVTKELLVRIFSYLRPYWKQLTGVLLLIAVSSWLGLLPSILTGRMIDEGILGRDLPVLIRLILLSLGVTILSNLIGVGQSYLNNWIAQHITFDMRNQMYRHLQTMSQRFFTENNQGDIITRMTSDIDGVQMIITSTFTNILSNAITLIVAMIAMFRKNPLLAALGIVIVPLFSIPTRRAGRTRWSLTKESQECNDRINGILNETMSVSGQLLVKLFVKEDEEYSRYEKLNEKRIRLNIRESMAGRWFFVVIGTFASIGPLLLYLAGGILIIRCNASLTVGDITVMVALLGRMYGPVNSLLNIQVDWIRSMALFTRIFEYFDMPAEICSPDNPVVPSKVSGKVEFSHVDFGYDPTRQILHDVSFTLEEGRSVAIVGPSGAGKSTVINLIPRLYDVNSGAVKFGGVDVRRLDLRYLRQNVGLVTQDTYLFNGTIRENLLYANPKATQKEIEEACRKANIYDFICAQEQGFESLVGNRGLKLSGGEKQRLSIARVLLKDPALLIFDEATSALDSISEQAIQDAIDPLIRERTGILIAHRLSTIMAADEILVMKDGRIVERGQHKELVEAGGVYTELYETQFRTAAGTGPAVAADAEGTAMGTGPAAPRG